VDAAHRDLRQPAAQRRRIRERRDLLERDEERLLDDVIDLGRVAQGALRHARDPPDIAPIDRLVRPGIAGACATHQLGVVELAKRQRHDVGNAQRNNRRRGDHGHESRHLLTMAHEPALPSARPRMPHPHRWPT